MTDTSQPLFLFGPGYCARALAGDWDGTIHAFIRQKTGEKGVISLRNTCDKTTISLRNTDDKAKFDLSLPEAIGNSHVLVSAPPDDRGCPALEKLRPYADQATSITYLSTTGVYGDLSGGWVFEDTPVNPKTIRARQRVAAERAWLAVRGDTRIVRLPGIYGPGRSALDRVRKGLKQRVVKPGQVFSRAHVDDIAAGLKALIVTGATGIFHICDEQAAPPQDVSLFAAELLGETPAPEVTLEAADLSDMARSFYSECKRVSNARLKAATGWRPAFPSYREGLAAILKAEG